MALVLSILLMLTLGAAEYGYAYFVKHNLQGAAREGSRAAILAGATSQNVTDAVKAVMDAGRMGASGYTVLVTDAATGKTADPGTAAAGTMIQVEVQCTWGAAGIRAMPVGGISPATVLKARAVMRKEG
jgi:Flp pilus assembly protein TadG